MRIRSITPLLALVALACDEPASPLREASSVFDGPYPAPRVTSEGEVVATVGPVAFTTEELERRLAEESTFVLRQVRDPAQLRAWVEKVVRNEAIAQRAWQDGLQNDPKVRKAFQQLLIRAYAERAMASSGSLEPNDKELLEAYEARRAEFDQPAKVRLSQIVRYVKTKPERRAAEKLLRSIRAEVIEGQKKNDHSRFSKAAREHSQDEDTRLGSGDLQFMTQAQLAERYGDDVAAACFDDAEVGDLFVAQAPNAVVLFKKTGYRKAIKRTFAQVRSQLRLSLSQDKRKAALQAWSRDVMEASEAEIDAEALSKVELPASTPPAGEDDG